MEINTLQQVVEVLWIFEEPPAPPVNEEPILGLPEESNQSQFVQDVEDFSPSGDSNDTEKAVEGSWLN